jgi:hypothetical protein
MYYPKVQVQKFRADMTMVLGDFAEVTFRVLVVFTSSLPLLHLSRSRRAPCVGKRNYGNNDAPEGQVLSAFLLQYESCIDIRVFCFRFWVASNFAPETVPNIHDS